MIPLYLLKYAKYGLPILIIAGIFFGGYWTKGKLVSVHIEGLKRELENSKASYGECVGIVDRFQVNLDEVEKVVKKQNAEIDKMAKDTQKAYEAALKKREEALAREKAAHAKAVEDMQNEYDRLYRKWYTLSAADACHEAWLEVGHD